MISEDFIAHSLRKLVGRRALYGGLDNFDRKVHRKLINESPPYLVGTLCRIWSGSVMDLARKFAMGMVDTPECPCGGGGPEHETCHVRVWLNGASYY